MTECSPKRARLHSIETFGLVDGPGVRFVAFLKGCSMRCKYCHNPDTWDASCGKLVESDQLLKQALRYRPYWKDNGGITVSGGEALLQIDFLIDFFQRAKQEGVHTTLDTSGNPFQNTKDYKKKFDQLMEVTDLFIVDIKHMNSKTHKELTGCNNENILAMIRYLSLHGKPLWVRHVLVPGITDDEENLEQLGEFLKELSTLEKFEILPYHTLGVAKWKSLGLTYPLEGVRTPSEAEIERAYKKIGI